MNRSFWADRSVFLTGHTGFKGSWLCLWLDALGARVHGYALAPDTEPALFNVAGVEDCLASHTLADVRDLASLSNAIRSAEPSVVFHLAAQPLVRASYEQPIDTFATNVLGTAHLLESVRACPSVRVVVNVTTDKCYENREWLWPYRESEPLGGRDPYSSSKACSELVSAAYRDSFLQAAGIALATARAGNVIGGGDWSVDRLVPDFLRALDARRSLEVRSPSAKRPWQHVLEPLSGYLLLAERLWDAPDTFSSAWNFGPAAEDTLSVSDVLDRLTALAPEASWTTDEDAAHPHEAGLLALDIHKAMNVLGWAPRWPLATALEKTLEWHRAWQEQGNMRQVSLDQIDRYLTTSPAR